jgi:hypothetical protein
MYTKFAINGKKEVTLWLYLYRMINCAMNLKYFAGVAVLCSMGLATNALGQQAKTYQKKGYTLTFTNNATNPDTVLRDRLADTYFKVYPEIAKTYNKQTLKQVAFVIDTAYHGVAATDNGRVVFNPQWFKQHPEDIDVVTHEVMHIAQDYKETVGPGWLTEGIADYVRYQFGINNAAAKWALPDFKPTQHYTNSYRVVARFLLWLDHKQSKGIVQKLDKQLREHTFTADSWKQLTGKTLDELWQQYAANPAL